MQPYIVVMIHICCNSTSSLIERRHRRWPYALAFRQTACPSLSFPFVISPDNTGLSERALCPSAPDGDSLKSRTAMNCGPLSLMIRDFSSWMPLQRPLDDCLDFCVTGHALAKLPVHDVSAATVQHARQVVKRPRDVDVRDVHMPVLVRQEGLDKAGSLLRRREPPVVEPVRLLEHAIDARWADGYQVVVEHHEGQAAITFKRMTVVEIDNGLFFPVLEPPVAGDLSVVLVDFAVTVLPVMRNLLVPGAEPTPRS